MSSPKRKFQFRQCAVLIVLISQVASCTAIPSWVKVTDKTSWRPRDSCGEVVFAGKMWLLGGWVDTYGIGPTDVWCSKNGFDWNCVTTAAAWKHSDLPTTLVFNDRIWMIAGWYGDHKPDASASNQVWASADGAKWELVTKAPWKPRLGAGGVVFKGKMWILGGTQHYFDGEQYLLNDVWSSTDGANWELVTEHAPWSPRAFHGAVVFGDKIWVFGGGNYRPTFRGYNDVWSSQDGLHWTRVTQAAAWSPRIWFSAIEYKNKMWLLGGWSDKPSKNYSDVWYTADGTNWTELKTFEIWSPRHEQSAFVFDDKLWIVGGNAWPLINDVWYLNLSDIWPGSN
jgi:hypothetical protein